MAYDFEQFDADRVTMQFSAVGAPAMTPRGLGLKRKRLALDDGADQAAIEAAFHRLLAWVESGQPVPSPDRAERAETQGSDAARTAPEQVPDQAVNPQAKRAGQGGPVEADIAKAKAKVAARDQKERAAYAAALAGQMKRHDHRRRAYPKVRPVQPAG